MLNHAEFISLKAQEILPKNSLFFFVSTVNPDLSNVNPSNRELGEMLEVKKVDHKDHSTTMGGVLGPCFIL